MGMATLNVWISGIDDPCSIDNRTWYVTIYNCDGNVLQWCGKRYVVLPARCGHLEVEVPPGCYYIKAVWSFSFAGGIFYVNHFTDAAIVQACCGETTCVTLFNPSLHRCGTIVIRALRDALQQKGIKAGTAREAERALNAALAEIPKPKKGFELDHLDELERLVLQQERPKGGRKKKE
jgi:hypothetical protein